MALQDIQKGIENPSTDPDLFDWGQRCFSVSNFAHKRWGTAFLLSPVSSEADL